MLIRLINSVSFSANQLVGAEVSISAEFLANLTMNSSNFSKISWVGNDLSNDEINLETLF